MTTGATYNAKARNYLHVHLQKLNSNKNTSESAPGNMAGPSIFETLPSWEQFQLDLRLQPPLDDWIPDDPLVVGPG